jgi:hypothetical protein
MSTERGQLGAGLRQAVAGIAAEGRAVRERVADAVADAGQRASEAKDTLLEVARDTAAGAREGLEKRAEADRNRTLREVLDGLGDGLGRTAHSAQLAFEEAAGRGRAYAEEDLAKLRRDFESLGNGLSGAVRNGLGAVLEQTADAAEHVERTAAGLRPSIEQVLSAARRDPGGLARGAVDASLGAGREAAGALFESMGRLLGRAGERLRRRPDAPGDSVGD